MGKGFLTRVGDDHALAGSQAVVLDDVGGAELVEGRGRLLGGGAGEGTRRRHASRVHDVLGEGLRALELGGRTARAEDRDAAGADDVGHSGDQRRLWSDDDQVDPELLGKVGHGFSVELVDRVQGGDVGDAGVAGSRVDGRDAGVLGQGTGESVLTAAGTDHEGLHGQ